MTARKTHRGAFPTTKPPHEDTDSPPEDSDFPQKTTGSKEGEAADPTTSCFEVVSHGVVRVVHGCARSGGGAAP